jgi:hypothetical protein
MFTKIVSKPQQPQVINAPFPLPWKLETRPIYINFDLWRSLSRPQRDLLLLRAVSNITQIQWFKPDIYQAGTLAGLVGVGLEVMQGDAIGIVIAGGLTALAASQIWRNYRNVQTELTADEGAVKVACRRGYTEADAAKHLLTAIQAVAEIEGRQSLNFTELLRCQNLKAIANLSPVGVPETVRKSAR